MTEKKVKLINALMQPINISAVIILGALTLVWGLWIVLPFIEALNAPAYSVMIDTLPEWAWGISAMATGTSIIFGVVKRKYRSLVIGTWIGTVFWLLTSVLLILGNWQNPYWILTLGVALYCAFVYLNIRLNRNNLPFNKDVVKL